MFNHSKYLNPLRWDSSLIMDNFDLSLDTWKVADTRSRVQDTEYCWGNGSKDANICSQLFDNQFRVFEKLELPWGESSVINPGQIFPVEC